MSSNATMRIGDVAAHAGVNVSLVRYYDRSGCALIDRAQRVRTWLEHAAGCDCQSIDGCALFDEAAAPPSALFSPGGSLRRGRA